jgi:hypothetical protein
MNKSLLRPLRPLFACLLMIALCGLFNSLTPESNVVSTNFERDTQTVIIPVYKSEVSRYKYIDTLEFPNWEVADTMYYEQYPGDERYTDIWETTARKVVNTKNVLTTPKHLFNGHTCSDEDRNVTYKK